MGAGAYPCPISPPKSLQCSLCDDGDTYTSIDELYDHSVVHLPKPSLVSLPIAAASHHPSRERSFRGCSHDGRGEETQADSSQVGGWRTWVSAAAQGNRSRSTRGRGRSHGPQKETHRLLQEHHEADGRHHQTVLEDRTDTRSLCRAIFDTVIMATEHDVVKSMGAQTHLHNEGVQAAGNGHTLGPLQIWAWGELIAGLQKQDAVVGAANAATLAGYLKQLDGLSMDTKCDHARFCIVDRTYQSEQARITLSVDR